MKSVTVLNTTGWSPIVMASDFNIKTASGEEWLIRGISEDNLADGKGEVDIRYMGPNGWVEEDKAPSEVVDFAVEMFVE
jgi:hypothetical protein